MNSTTTIVLQKCLCETDGCNKDLEDAGKIGKKDLCGETTEGGNTGGNNTDPLSIFTRFLKYLV